MTTTWKTDPDYLRDLYIIEGLLNKGYAHIEIADALGLTIEKVTERVQHLAELLQDESKKDREELRAFVLQELKRLKGMAHEIEDYEGVRRIIHDIRQLMGLDAPRQIDIDVDINKPIAWVEVGLDEDE